jgi:hypothetical protein
VNAADYAIIDTSFQSQVGTLAAGLISMHTAQFGDAYLQALHPPATVMTAVVPTALATLPTDAPSALSRL